MATHVTKCETSGNRRRELTETVQFVLTHSDFVQYSKLADETLASSNPEAAGEFIKKVSDLKRGRVTLVARQYGKGPTAETVKWMTFEESIVVPESFQPSELP